MNISITNGGERFETAKRFLVHQNATEAVEWFDYHEEEIPPFYYEHKRGLLLESIALNQFALNDFMAMG